MMQKRSRLLIFIAMLGISRGLCAQSKAPTAQWYGQPPFKITFTDIGGHAGTVNAQRSFEGYSFTVTAADGKTYKFTQEFPRSMRVGKLRYADGSEDMLIFYRDCNHKGCGVFEIYTLPDLKKISLEFTLPCEANSVDLSSRFSDSELAKESSYLQTLDCDGIPVSQKKLGTISIFHKTFK